MERAFGGVPLPAASLAVSLPASVPDRRSAHLLASLSACRSAPWSGLRSAPRPGLQTRG